MKLAHRSSLIATCGLAALTLSGCQKAANPTPTVPPQASQVHTASAPPRERSDSQRKTILAAAERFENLTEAAFDGAKPTAAALALAHRDAQTARPLLDASEAATLDRQLHSVDAAAANDVAADVSLAAVEAYRTLITASDGEGKIPLLVGLLDYSGFRFWADAKAAPPRWADMTAARDYAAAQWALVKPRIHDPAAIRKFEGALGAMASAVARQNSTAAVKAGTLELDLVDELEKLVV